MPDDEFLTVSDDNLDEVRRADLGVLILTKSDCGYCESYQSEVAALRREGKLPNLVVGKMVLDRPGSVRFKRDNPWLAKLDYLPHTLIYRRGEQVDDFSASKGSYLRERVEDLRRSVSP